MIRQNQRNIELETQNSLPKNALVFIQQPTTSTENLIQDEASLLTFAQNQSNFNSNNLDNILVTSAQSLKKKKRVISDINVENLERQDSRSETILYPIDSKFQQQNRYTVTAAGEYQNSGIGRQRNKNYSYQQPPENDNNRAR